MSVAAKTKPRSRRRRRDEDVASGDDSDASEGTSGSASGSEVESGSEAEEEEEKSEREEDHDETDHETDHDTEKEPARNDHAAADSHGDESSVKASDASDASEPEEIPFEEFTADASPQSPTDQPKTQSHPSSSRPAPAPAPRQSNRQAYLSRIAADPTFVPRVGKFWTHDERHYAAGKVGQGEYAGLREMSEYWRGRGRGRGAQRGFQGGARGGARGGRVDSSTSEARNPPSSGARNTSSEARNPSSTSEARIPPSSGARNTSSDASKTPIQEKDIQTAESSNEPTTPTAESSTQPPSAAQTPTLAPPNATTSATKWNAAEPGRSDRGSWAHDGYAQLAREEELRAAARERNQRGRGGRGMVRGMFRGRGRGGYVPTVVHAVAQSTPVEVAPVESASAPLPPVDAPVVADDAVANPPFSDHEPSAITAHLQSQAEQAESIQQQQLADAAARLSLSPHPHPHAQSPRPASGPPTILPPGIAMHPSGTFYDIHTGQPVVWVPSPAPNVPRYSDPYPQQQAYPQPQTYPYPPYPYYRQQEYYPPPPFRNDSPFMPYPQSVDPSYFIPPRPQSKIEIRAPGQPPSTNPNSGAIASSTLKDPSRVASQGGYQQRGYQGYEYGTMGYQ